MKKSFLLIASLMVMLLVALPDYSQAAIVDGTHTLNYQVNKPGSTSASMANDYFLKPARLIVKDGKMTVQLTIKNSTWVTEFNPPGGATVISSNASADQRIVQFAVSSVDKLTVAMKIDIDDIDYHHGYSVDFVFNGSGLPEAPKAQPVAPATNNNTSSGSNTSSNKETPSTSEAQSTKPSTQQSKPTPNEDLTEAESAADSEQESVEEKATENTEEVENPETSDAMPFIYIVVFMAAALLFVRTKREVN